jgi:hypothetical protein
MQRLGTVLGVDFMKRQSEIDSVGGKAVWEEGFNHEEGMKNLEQTLLQWGSLFSIFEEGETQYQSTKDAIAAFKGAFTAINGFTIPDLDTTWLDTWVKDNLSIDKFPTLDISAIQTKIASAITELTPSFDISAIQDKINTAITAITDYDFESLMTTVGNKIKSIWDGIFEKIYEFLPWLRPEETKTTTTQQPLPPYAGSLDYVFSNGNNGNNNNQAEEDPITAGWNWIVGGVNEQIKGWTG